MMKSTDARVLPRFLSVSEPAKSFIRKFEALRLKAYQDGGGVWTIGWGHTAGVKMGDEIDEATARKYFQDDLRRETAILRLDENLYLLQREFDALSSFVFNIGATQWSKSTMRRALHAKRYDLAADEFQRWNKDNGRVVAGLTRRRREEKQMFLVGDYRAE